ncbi:MAG: DNA repair protein RadC [Deferribacteraceae bacterium]|jgi:DNA repair protein RadC|nr:DNA repair protein RadC [Deferribacteraceae bacterium]
MDNQKPHYLEHRKRLRERFLKAPEAVPDSEIIELLLGYVIHRKDVKLPSKDIIFEIKKLSNIFDGNLKSVKGVGSETVCFFRILQEFIVRYEYQKVEDTSLDLSKTDYVYRFLKPKIAHASKEIFVIILLNAKNKFIKCKKVREGFIASVNIAAREIIEFAIENDALGVIIAHNHPSKDPHPSESDLIRTKEICHALYHTGVTLLDHMIVSSHEYYSMSAYGHVGQFYDEAKRVLGKR